MLLPQLTCMTDKPSRPSKQFPECSSVCDKTRYSDTVDSKFLNSMMFSVTSIENHVEQVTCLPKHRVLRTNAVRSPDYKDHRNRLKLG